MKYPLPFTNMALSLSGGGYRAATFHLGSMSYLHSRTYGNQTLLENVRIISTISGGTITGAMYALKMASGQGFMDCYKKLYDLFDEDKLVDHALEKLNNPEDWRNEHKTRDLINAFAEVYNEHFFDEATFANLYDGEKSHLQDAIFGSSEFTYGIQFRLQEDDDAGKFGNYYLNLPLEAAKKMRLADATAASSCFPGGFEPIVMPDDFGNGPESEVNKSWFGKSYDGTPYPRTAIMDGGIIDNQGIEGVKLAEQRSKTEDQDFIGTYIVSDVSSDMMAKYPVPELKRNSFAEMITLCRINWMAWLFIIAFIILLIFNSNPILLIAGTVLTTISCIWLLGFYFVSSNMKSQIQTMFGANQASKLVSHLNVLNHTPINILIYLVKFRASSVIKMVSDIFLRRIRRLQLTTLYKSDEWNYRFKSNYIYELKKKLGELPKSMSDIITSANNMPTTLWFSDEDKKNKVLDHLITCGQFTMCYNLIKYIDRMQTGDFEETFWSTLPENERSKILDLQKELKSDWEKFLANPSWLFEKYKIEMMENEQV